MTSNAHAQNEDRREIETAPETTLEIVTFRLSDTAETEDFLKAARETEAMLRASGALIRRFLTVDSHGLWTDVIEWSSHEAALATAKAVMTDPSFTPFMTMIDPSSANMRHARVLWRMD